MLRPSAISACAISFLLLVDGFAPGPSAPALPPGWPSGRESDVTRDGAAVQVTRAMTLDLPADADAAFPLFGPVRESEWSPDWRPAFIAPAPPGQSVDGAVFTTGGQDSPTVWVMTDYDPVRRMVRYVHVRPGELVSQVWIVVRPATPHASQADVTFRQTLLGPAGREPMDHFIHSFPRFKPHWEHAIGAALGGAGHAQPGH